MKTCDEVELIYFTVLIFVSALGGMLLVGVTDQLLAGTNVTLFTDFFKALCVAVPCAAVFNVTHQVIFLIKAKNEE